MAKGMYGAQHDWRPGQLWRWNFAVSDGWWMLQKVTEVARYAMLDLAYTHIKRGDVFTVVTLDDPGPYEFGTNLPDFDENGMLKPPPPPKRWHVVLVPDGLVWFDHKCFEQAELVQDVK